MSDRVLKRTDPKPGGWVAMPNGTRSWCGKLSWDEAAGPVRLVMTMNQIGRAENCLFADGSRGMVEQSLDHKYDLTHLHATGRLPTPKEQVYRRQTPDGYVFGRLEIGADDVAFIEMPDLNRKRDRELAGLEADLHASAAMRAKVADLDYAERLYETISGNSWLKNGEEWSCSLRYAGGLVADLRGRNESYVDFYSLGNYGQVDAGVQADLNALGWILEEDNA